MNNSIPQIDRELLASFIVPRFLRYVTIWTTSDRLGTTTPSTPGQWDLAKLLGEELRSLGIADVTITNHCYVIARLPPSPGKEAAPTIGLLAHIDTAPDAPGKNVNPQRVYNYDGKPIQLADGYALDPQEDPELLTQLGGEFIHSDGKTLLGADNKAGIAEIMGVLEYLLGHPEIPHGQVEIIFTPDEEIGKGLDMLPLQSLQATACYTLDGGPRGELEIECFNAYGVSARCIGRAIHPGTARGLLANAALMAASLACMLPRSESPEATDGYYGYYHVTDITGNTEEALLELIIRDFDLAKAQERLQAVQRFAKAVEAQFPGGEIQITETLQYYNMRKKIEEKPQVLELLQRAAEEAEVGFALKPIRGGTDGSRLTELGIPTPNIFTGGRNFHSRTEWVSVSDMKAAAALTIALIRLWGEETNEGIR